MAAPSLPHARRNSGTALRAPEGLAQGKDAGAHGKVDTKS